MKVDIYEREREGGIEGEGGREGGRGRESVSFMANDIGVNMLA